MKVVSAAKLWLLALQRDVLVGIACTTESSTITPGIVYWESK